MSLTFTHLGTLYIVLDEENIERIKNADPYDFNQAKVSPGPIRIPLSIVICYAHSVEYERIAQIATPEERIAYLSRGYKQTASDERRGLGPIPFLHRTPDDDKTPRH